MEAKIAGTIAIPNTHGQGVNVTGVGRMDGVAKKAQLAMDVMELLGDLSIINVRLNLVCTSFLMGVFS